MEESLGYVFEKIVLYITSLGLGTCWLGGSFNKADFEKAITLEEDEFIPVISPMGYIFLPFSLFFFCVYLHNGKLEQT